MEWLVLLHLVAMGLTLALGVHLGGRTPREARRRTSMKWAFDAAHKETSRLREEAAAASQEAASQRARCARLEAELAALRTEKDDGAERLRVALDELTEKSWTVARLQAAMDQAEGELRQLRPADGRGEAPTRLAEEAERMGKLETKDLARVLGWLGLGPAAGEATAHVPLGPGDAAPGSP